MSPWELHPAMVHFPIALLLSGVAFDLVAWWRANENMMRAATWLLVAGVATGILAANFGLLAFYTVPAHTSEAHHLMYWHLGTALTALFFFAWVAIARWLRRATHPSTLSRAVGMVAAAILIAAGGLGGYIVYHGGAGVDPELLAAEVREGHSHGEHDGQEMQGMNHADADKGQSNGVHPESHRNSIGAAGSDPKLVASAKDEKHAHGKKDREGVQGMNHAEMGEGRSNGMGAESQQKEKQGATKNQRPSTVEEGQEHQDHGTKAPAAESQAKKDTAAEAAGHDTENEGHEMNGQRQGTKDLSRRKNHEPKEMREAPIELPKIPPPNAKAAKVPSGYRVEVVADELEYPTSVEFDAAGAMYVAEGGYVYGDDVAPARVLRISAEGKKDVVADQLLGPVTDLLWDGGRLFISQRGKISVLDAGSVRDLVTDLPSLGDHHNNQMAIGPDGKLYFGQGTATNSGVVGLDNFKMGWLTRHPTVHDVPAKDIRLPSKDSAEGHARQFESLNLLAMLADGGEDSTSGEDDETKNANMPGMEGMDHSEMGMDHAEAGNMHGVEEMDHGKAGDMQGQGHDMHMHGSEEANHGETGGMMEMVQTEPFQPFGKIAPPDGAIRGQTKANGTILRMNIDGSNLEVYAWGLRNPYGLVWGADDKLYASDNGYDERGSRPIAHAPDCVWEIKLDAWYGFPDYAGGVPVTDARFKPERGPAPRFLMHDHPRVETPFLNLKHHVGAAKIELSTSDRFGFKGNLFLALAGDMNPITGKHPERSGFEVLRIDIESGIEETFFSAKPSALGPEGFEYVATAGPKRPVDVRFSPNGEALYVVDLGALAIIPTATGPAPRPFPQTGVIWRITRTDERPRMARKAAGLDSPER